MTHRILLAAAVVLAYLGLSPVTHAGQLGTTVPSNCQEHTSFSGGDDAPGDYRCAGLAIDLHVDGAQFSPFPIWAGQWLFVDESHQFRVGSCTFNRGVHPNVLGPSDPVAQQFPNDPSGAKRAYLTWRYGDTRDDLTAAALWAVFHFYAQDAAGTNRSTVGTAPLITDLSRVSEMSGNQALEDLAVALDAEAARLAGPYTISLTVQPDGAVSVLVAAGAYGLWGVPVVVHVGGMDGAIELTTEADGLAFTRLAPVEGTTAVSAVAGVPGPALVYQGSPASPDPHGAQTLLTGGAPLLLTANASVDVPVTTTSTTAPATTVPEAAPTTTEPATTTTELATTTTQLVTTTTELATTTTDLVTTTVPPTTVPETTAPPATELVTSLPPTTLPPALPETTVPPVPADPLPSTTVAAVPEAGPEVASALPRTGGEHRRIAYLGTALVVGGIGLSGLTRRPDRRPSAPDRS